MHGRVNARAQCSEEAYETDGHVDMHKQLAAAFAGADGEEAAEAEGEAKPGGNERGVVDASSAEEAGKAEQDQEEREDEREFSQAETSWNAVEGYQSQGCASGRH